MGLAPEQIVNAFGITGIQASGLCEVCGTMSKPFHAGKAAMDGVLSVTLAKRNFDSSHEMKEKFMGLDTSVIPEENAEKIVEKIGDLEDIPDVNEIISLCNPV
jgi:2-methylcitrate dehydratase PrpD